MLIEFMRFYFQLCKAGADTPPVDFHYPIELCDCPYESKAPVEALLLALINEIASALQFTGFPLGIAIGLVNGAEQGEW